MQWKNENQDEGIAIGIIGPDALVNKIMKVIQDFPSFHPIPKVYRTEDEAPGLAEAIADEVEVLLLTGPVPYRRVRDQTSLSIPVQYVPLTDTGLFRALYRLRHHDGMMDKLNLSIDTLTKLMVESSLKDIHETSVNAVYFDGSPFASKEELVRFHKEKYENGLCDAALTAEQSVSISLTELGIPNEWVIPTDGNIVVALERALLSTETRKSKESQIVVGLINVDEFGRYIQHHTSEHEIQKFKLDIHRTLLDYVESLGGYLTHLGGDEYLFFTTRGIFERETGGYKSVPLARNTSKALGLTLSIGIGFGLSANEAGSHARIALRKAKEAGGNACFILREDRTIIGPLEMTDPIEQALSLTDLSLIQKAENAGMSSAYLSKLMSQVARTGKIDYQVHELAAVLDITVRSMHRLLLQWVEGGLVDITGMEKVPKGRPRQIFRLTILSGEVQM